MTLTDFVNLSSALTGVDSQQLQPSIDPIQIAEQYFQTLTANIDATILNNLMTLFGSVSDPLEAATKVLADPMAGPVGRSIIKLWLLGAWYSPTMPSQAVNVVSAQAYKESLVWKVMQSHPMGYSMFNFGYWAKQPPALDQFITFAKKDSIA